MPIYETDKLGFPIEDPYFIPNEYLDNKKFIVFRTCHSIGDWGIISAFPRLLKQKYPDCKVYIPSTKLLQEMYQGFTSWSHWKNPYQNASIVFKNNPYVDAQIDNIEDEVFHDHYRIYDEKNPEIPLIKQMLNFWQFTEQEMEDCMPDLYFSEEEKTMGNSVIEKWIGNDPYGTLLLTNTVQDYYSDETNEKLLREVERFGDMKFFYYGNKKISETIFSKTNYVNLKELNLDIRIQLYIKTKALINIGYQSGVNDSVCRYSQVVCTPSTGTLGADYLNAIKYLR